VIGSPQEREVTYAISCSYIQWCCLGVVRWVNAAILMCSCVSVASGQLSLVYSSRDLSRPTAGQNPLKAQVQNCAISEKNINSGKVQYFGYLRNLEHCRLATRSAKLPFEHVEYPRTVYYVFFLHHSPQLRLSMTCWFDGCKSAGSQLVYSLGRASTYVWHFYS
jgi:hypothetical protein